MSTIKRQLFDLVHDAEKLRADCEYKKALSIYLRILRQHPDELFVRLKIAEILQDVGEFKLSNKIFASLAEHFTKTGLPMLAIVAMKYLQPLQPQLYQGLRDAFASIYFRKSERISTKTRLRTWDENPVVEFPQIALDENDDRLIKVAAKIASMIPGSKKYPGLLPAIPFLSAFDAKSLATIIDDLRILFFHQDEMLMEEGEEGDVLHILSLGHVRVLKKNESGGQQQLAVLGRGAVMGEISFLTGAPRNASIQSVGPSVVLKIPRNTLLRIQQAKPKLFQLLRVQAVRRILVNVLRTSVLFQDMTDMQKTVLLKMFQSKHFGKKDTIIEEGTVGQGLFLLLTGRADVVSGTGKSRKDLAVLKEGDIFGEISLIMDRTTTATVLATTQVHTLFLPRADFNKVMTEFPQVKERIEKISRDRLIDNAQILGDYSEPLVEEVEVDSWAEQEISEILELEPFGDLEGDTPPPPPFSAIDDDDAPEIDLDESISEATDSGQSPRSGSGPLPQARSSSGSGPLPQARSSSGSGPQPPPRPTSGSGPLPSPRSSSGSGAYPPPKPTSGSGPLPVPPELTSGSGPLPVPPERTSGAHLRPEMPPTPLAMAPRSADDASSRDLAESSSPSIALPTAPRKAGRRSSSSESLAGPRPTAPDGAPGSSAKSSPTLELVPDGDAERRLDPTAKLRPLETKDLPKKRLPKDDDDDFELEILED
ncbi:MAG: cyclic nucleotide-binding domain-containing protein [Myxococcales bacterium]|nr:cyclic nucleotide-binding domain-containing protein [Myxococcales bacterium]